MVIVVCEVPSYRCRVAKPDSELVLAPTASFLE
jgi:hypothetical protein